MKSKEKNIDAILRAAIIAEGREEARGRFNQIIEKQESLIHTMTDEYLSPISRAAFGHHKSLDFNPLRISEKTLQEFMEEEVDCPKEVKSKKKKKPKKK